MGLGPYRESPTENKVRKNKSYWTKFKRRTLLWLFGPWKSRWVRCPYCRERIPNDLLSPKNRGYLRRHQQGSCLKATALGATYEDLGNYLDFSIKSVL